MQPNFTLKKIGSFLRSAPVLLVLFFFLTGKISAQTYVNGVLGTGATSKSGVAAPAGTQWHEMQNNTGNTTETNVSIAFNNSSSSNSSTADDFTVPAGPSWAITKMYFYGLQVAPTATSPITGIRVRIHNSSPLAGPTTVVFGDLTTNRMANTYFSNVYAIANSQVPAPGTAPNLNFVIWTVEANVAVTLAPGTYWVEWQMICPAATYSLMSQPLNARTVAGYNGINNFNNAGWVATVDGGNPASAPDVAVDYAYKIDYTTGPCSGTPSPGATLPATLAVCGGVPFTLSLANQTLGSGLTYQWQSATTLAGTYTNITGATSSTYSSTLPGATTYYRCIVTCSATGNSVTSTPATVSLNTPTNCYCTPPATNCTLSDVITNVTFGTINNTSACAASGYTNYTASVAAATGIVSGAANPMKVTVGPGGTEYVGVWIDYNQNGSFETTEFTALGNGNGVTINGNINIPATALTGTTRMRVRVEWNTPLGSADACIGYTYGETEDYNVTIAACVPVVIGAQPANATTVCGSNATFTVATTGSLPVYQWQQRISAAAPWTTVTNGVVGGVTFAGATTATLSLTNVPSSYSGYSYRVLVSGACTAIDFSTAGTLTVTPLIAIVNPASATICAGSIQPLSLTNAASSATTTVSSGTISVAIPDGPFPGPYAASVSTIPVNLPVGSVITGLSVKLNITHAYVGDVVAVLKAPNGNVFNLDALLTVTNNPGANFVNTVISSTGTNLLSAGTAPFTNTYKPDAAGATFSIFGFTLPGGPTGYIPNVSTFSGLYSVPNGNWTLALYDAGAPDAGVLTNWSMDITYGAPVVGVWTPFTGLYSDALATIPYTGTPVTTVYAKPAVSTNYSVTFSTATCTTPPTIVPVNVSTPVTGLAITANSAGCVGGSATFTATTTGGGPVTYQWQESPPSGTSFTDLAGATSATLTLSNLTTATTGYKYRVIATAAGCGSVTSSVGTLKVNVLPKISISTSNTQLTPGVFTSITGVADSASVAGGGFSWTLNGSAVVRGNGLTTLGAITIDSVGSYQATYKDKNGCVSAASNIIVIGSQQSDRLWIYPNPSPGQFQVRLYYSGTPTEKRVVTIYNQLGEKVITKSFSLDNAGNNYLRMDFDLSKNQAGTYLVKVNGQYYGQEKAGFVIIQK